MDTKWLEFCADTGGTAWLEYRLLPGSKPAAVLRYMLTAASEIPEPCDWVLEGEPADNNAAASSGGALQEHTAESEHASTMQALCHYAHARCRCAGCWLELDRRESKVIQAEGKAKVFKVPTALCRCAACASLPSLSSARLVF